MSITRNQLIHVGVEALAISTVFLYLNSKINKLCERIDELENVVSEQKENIKQHEQVILELVVSLNNLRTSNVPENILKPKIETPKQVVILATPPKVEKKKENINKVEEIVEEEKELEIPFENEEENINDEQISDKCDEETCSTVLDKELEEELKDLS